MRQWALKSENCPMCRVPFTASAEVHRYIVGTLNDFIFKCSKCPETFKYSDQVKHEKACKLKNCPLCETQVNEP